MTKVTKEMLRNVFSTRRFVLKVTDPVKPLNSHSAQSFLTSPFEMVRACSCMANTSCNWCQMKENKLNFVTM